MNAYKENMAFTLTARLTVRQAKNILAKFGIREDIPFHKLAETLKRCLEKA